MSVSPGQSLPIACCGAMSALPSKVDIVDVGLVPRADQVHCSASQRLSAKMKAVCWRELLAVKAAASFLGVSSTFGSHAEPRHATIADAIPTQPDYSRLQQTAVMHPIDESVSGQKRKRSATKEPVHNCRRAVQRGVSYFPYLSGH
jgi:hypothetical protein